MVKLDSELDLGFDKEGGGGDHLLDVSLLLHGSIAIRVGFLSL